MLERCPGVPAPIAVAIVAFAGTLSISAASFSVDHAAAIQHDFTGQTIPKWSGGALVAFMSNQTAAPVLLEFDDQGQQSRSVVLTIPDSETINIRDTARGEDGALAACGSAFDHAGRGSGFLALVSPGGTIMVSRLDPYYPTLIAIDPDGSLWTAGIETINGRDTGAGIDRQHGVIRHFDREGKQIGSFIPRTMLASSHFTSAIMTQGSRLQAAHGRLGWYTGPLTGRGSEYYEVLSDGTVRKYPAIGLAQQDQVTGLALTDDGNNYLTTFSPANHASQLLSISSASRQWQSERFPEPPAAFVSLYGGDGERLVFWNLDHRKMTFVDVSK